MAIVADRPTDPALQLQVTQASVAQSIRFADDVQIHLSLGSVVSTPGKLGKVVALSVPRIPCMSILQAVLPDGDPFGCIRQHYSETVAKFLRVSR